MTTWTLYLVVPVVALLATACGILFERGTLRLRRRLAAQRRVPRRYLPLLGGFFTWCIAIVVFLGTSKIGIFGLGYGDLSNALGSGIPWRLAGVLAAAKIAATAVSYSFGGCGGIFSPTLFIGGMCGFCVAGATTVWLPLASSDQVILAGVGMCTCLCAVIRAPLTSLLIVFEMTHEFSMVPPLMIGIITCEAVTRLFGNQNFYTSLLLQDGHELIRINPPRDLDSWRNITAEQMMSTKVVAFESQAFENARQLLDESPFRCFPVRQDGVLVGVVTRDDLRQFGKSGREPHIETAVTCGPQQTVRELADKFIQSPSGIIVVTGDVDRKILGVLTLHDLLRAQAAVLDG